MAQHGETRIYVLKAELKMDASKTVKEWKYSGASGEKLKGEGGGPDLNEKGIWRKQLWKIKYSYLLL